MRTIATHFIKAVTLSWLTGPIFDKELRVSSRRKRNFILRVVYLVILLLIVSLIWAEEFGSNYNSTVYQVSRLSQMGLVITGIVVIVQYFAAQIITVVMLSNSISDEIYNRTLGTLMSTPITSLQIVCGKILSKLLQIILLLCLTLPILGIIRVFGGVPWAFLVHSMCVTLTTVIFVGTLTLNFSIHHKHAFTVIIQVILLGLLIFLLLPFFGAWIAIEQLDYNENTIFEFVAVLNPWFMMEILLLEMVEPRGIPISSAFWGWHCLFMLTCSTLLFLRAVIVVRKKALQQACGQLNLKRSKKNTAGLHPEGKIRHIKGPPLIWKELRLTAVNSKAIKTIAFLALIIACVLFSYYICVKEDSFRYSESHIMYAMVFSILSVFFTATFSATTITTEKSGQTWPALMCTQITEVQIIIAKVIGVLKRSSPYWGLLFLHLLIFTGTYINPALWPHTTLIVIPMIFFTLSSGILFSTLLKHTTSAVVANLIFIAMIWAGIPVLFAIMGSVAHDHSLADTTIMVNPFYDLAVVMDETCGTSTYNSEPINTKKMLHQLQYNWEGGGTMGYFGTTAYLGFIGLLYIGAGLFFLWIAKTQLRRRIF